MRKEISGLHCTELSPLLLFSMSRRAALRTRRTLSLAQRLSRIVS